MFRSSGKIFTCKLSVGVVSLAIATITVNTYGEVKADEATALCNLAD